MRPSLSLRLIPLTAAALVLSCTATKTGQRLKRDDVSIALKRLEVVKLDLGEFPIDGANAVVDGDTIRVKGLDNSMRLLGLDTEETFKHDDERNAYAAGWDRYKKKMRGDSSRPVKMATPRYSMLRVTPDGRKAGSSREMIASAAMPTGMLT